MLLSIDSNFGHRSVVRRNFLHTKDITCTYTCTGVFSTARKVRVHSSMQTTVLSTCAGKAATRYSLGSRLTVAGHHFLHLFALLSADLVMIASSSSLSSSLCCQFASLLELPTLRPKTRSCSRENEVFCCDVHLRSIG